MKRNQGAFIIIFGLLFISPYILRGFLENLGFSFIDFFVGWVVLMLCCIPIILYAGMKQVNQSKKKSQKKLKELKRLIKTKL